MAKHLAGWPHWWSNSSKRVQNPTTQKGQTSLLRNIYETNDDTQSLVLNDWMMSWRNFFWMQVKYLCRQSSRHCMPESNLVDFSHISIIKLFIWSTVGLSQRWYPTKGKTHLKLSYLLLILSNNKENDTFTWPAGKIVQSSVNFVITLIFDYNRR